MKAARFHNHHDIRIENVARPIVKPGEVLVDIHWGGICGSDLHEYLIGPKAICTPESPHKLTGGHLPVTMGHEFCGRIASVPDDTLGADGTLLREAGATHMCVTWGFLGLHGAGGGGFAESCAVRADMCYPLPREIRLDHAALIEPLAVGRHAIVQSGVSRDDLQNKSVLVIGGGPVGLALLLNLAAIGVMQTFVSEPAKARRELVKPYTDVLLDPLLQNVVQECQAATDGKGVDLVFDCAGIPAGMQAGMSALAIRGTYVNVAGWEAEFLLPIQHVMAKEIQLRSTLAYDDKDFGDVVKDFVAGKFKGAEAMITARISLDDIVEDGFEQLIRNKDRHSKIIATPRADLLPQKSSVT